MTKNYFFIFHVTNNAVKVLTYEIDCILNHSSGIYLFHVESIMKVIRITNTVLPITVTAK